MRRSGHPLAPRVFCHAADRGLFATMTRTVPVGPIRRSPSTRESPPIRSRPWRRTRSALSRRPYRARSSPRHGLLPSPFRRPWQIHNRRHEARPSIVARLAPLASFAPPTEQLLGCQPMAARNHRHRRPSLQPLRNDPRLVVYRSLSRSRISTITDQELHKKAAHNTAYEFPRSRPMCARRARATSAQPAASKRRAYSWGVKTIPSNRDGE